MQNGYRVNHAVDIYSDMIRRICICHLKSKEDIEDIFQNVFLKYMMYDGEFSSDEHEKAWLIRVCINECNDYFRRLFSRNTISFEEIEEQVPAAEKEDVQVLQAVLSLPEKYRDVIYLFYFEQYSAVEIAKMLGKKENTVYSILSRGRTMLKGILGGEERHG